ncbi:MAG: hypothetical protein L6Q49_08500 [Anaerolineales bacterium]|nr:hypothetical protein [Anaerolineales bacterium]
MGDFFRRNTVSPGRRVRLQTSIWFRVEIASGAWCDGHRLGGEAGLSGVGGAYRRAS